MNKSKVSMLWTAGHQQDKESFQQTVSNSTELLTRLDEILVNMQVQILDEESSGNQYSEGWVYEQAHRNGKKDVLRQLKKLTEHLDQR